MSKTIDYTQIKKDRMAIAEAKDAQQKKNIINDPLGIQMWNKGNFKSLEAGAILKRLEDIPQSDDAVTLTKEDMKRLWDENEFQTERMIDKYR